ncbi:MAG TPA: APC family permease [Streptosporangiaceae bacterium]|nr:APC family permease [Streptosporangiaceae bacterium]
MTTGAGDGPSAAGVGAEAPGAEPDPCVEGNENAANDEKSRLTALEGLAALSLDALSSVAYGPEAIVVVLVAAGAAGLNYTLPVTLTIVALLGILVISYRQVIAAFPNGGGAYAVARRHLGRQPSLIAGAALIIDYVLNAAVGVSAGIAALTSAFPALYGARVWLCLAALAIITGLNLRGVAESARIFIGPTIAFIAAIGLVIIAGLLRSHPAVPPAHTAEHAVASVGALLLLRAFASGCSALTGVEAIANAVPSFRTPRVRRAQHTEVALGTLLGLMLIGLSVLIRKFHVGPVPGKTVLAQLADAAVGHNVVFYLVQLTTLLLLALAANTSFGGLPVLLSLLARDNYLPHLFFLRADRQVHRYGVWVLALLAAILLVVASGNTQALVPVFAIGVFVGFTLSQVGMVRHWHAEHGQGWQWRATVNGVGAAASAAAVVIELVSKFTAGGWLVVVTIPALVLLFLRIHRTYDRIGALLELGKRPKPPHPQRSLVVVPVNGMSRLTQEAISAALSLGDDVIAVTVCYGDPEEAAALDEFRAQWNTWHPNVPLVTLHSRRRSLAVPIVEYLRQIESEDRYHRLVVLIPEVQPARPWQWILHNQRGQVLSRAIRRGTGNVVVCRLRFRLNTWQNAGDEAVRQPTAG